MSIHDDSVDAAAYAVTAPTSRPKVRGWLLVLAILHSIVYPIVIGLYAAAGVSLLGDAVGDSSFSNVEVNFLFAVVLQLIAIIVGSLISGVLIWVRHKSAVWITQAVVGFNLAFFTIAFFATHFDMWFSFGASLLYAVAVFVYLHTSKRVAATFGV